MNSHDRNVFIYWIGKEYKLIKLLRELIYLHSDNGNNYKVHFINENNINEYIDIPNNFYDFQPAHQADILRVKVINKYGGIWLDSDTIVLDNLSSLFKILDNYESFFVTEYFYLTNGVFGSRPGVKIISEWEKHIDSIIENIDDEKNLKWTLFGANFLNKKENKKYIESNCFILDGIYSIYMIPTNPYINKFFGRSCYNFLFLKDVMPPCVMLTNSVYKHFEENSHLLINKNILLTKLIEISNENHLNDEYNSVDYHLIEYKLFNNLYPRFIFLYLILGFYFIKSFVQKIISRLI